VGVSITQAGGCGNGGLVGSVDGTAAC
jgi:hypothetical protein